MSRNHVNNNSAMPVNYSPSTIEYGKDTLNNLTLVNNIICDSDKTNSYRNYLNQFPYAAKAIMNSGYMGLNVATNASCPVVNITAAHLIMLFGVQCTDIIGDSVQSSSLCRNILWRSASESAHTNLSGICVLSIVLRLLTCDEAVCDYDAHKDNECQKAVLVFGHDILMNQRPGKFNPVEDPYDSQPVQANVLEVVGDEVSSVLNMEIGEYYCDGDTLLGKYYGCTNLSSTSCFLYFDNLLLPMAQGDNTYIGRRCTVAIVADPNVRRALSPYVYSVSRNYYWSNMAYNPPFDNEASIANQIVKYVWATDQPADLEYGKLKLLEALRTMYMPGTKVKIYDANVTSLSPSMIRSVSWDLAAPCLSKINWEKNNNWKKAVSAFFARKTSVKE